MVWLRRTLGIAALSFGLILLGAPFPTSLTGSSSVSTIRLDMGTAPLDFVKALELYGGPIAQLTAENLEAAPGLRRQLPQLWNAGGTVCVPAEDWQWLVGLLGEKPPVDSLYVFRDSLQRITDVDARLGVGEVCFTSERIATFDDPDFDPAVHLDLEALVDYPQVSEAVQARQQVGPDAGPAGPSITEAEWNRFRRRELPAGKQGAEFVADGALFWGVEEESFDDWQRPTPWLRPVAIAVGAALALIGAAILVGMYRRRAARPGTATQPIGIAIFGDIITLTAALFVALGTVDAVWSAALGQPGLMPTLTGAEPGELSAIGFVSLLGIAFGMPLMTLAVSLITEQRIVIDDVGITSLGVVGRADVPWTALEAVRITGKGSKSLVELIGGGRTINISQASASSRHEITNALNQHAPVDKQHLLRQLEAEW